MMSFHWHEFWVLTCQATILVCFWMLLLWMVHLFLRNASIVDAGWAFGIAFCAALYGWKGSGALDRRWVISLMVLIWGIRLGLHLCLRILGHAEEGRYGELRRKWGSHIELKFLAFYMVQAISCVLLTVPILLSCLDKGQYFSLLEKAAIILWVIAMAGVTLADIQLSRFKSLESNKGKVCRQGLWGWSRHPNYFFEWLIWLSYGLFALASPFGWIGMIAPALILHFVINVTGIPPTEEQALRSKGEAYRTYQREVSAFIPMAPKTVSTN